MRCRIVSTIILCLVVSGLPLTAGAKPFSFTDYCKTVDMTNALREMLPRGTSKSVVDEKLVSEGGATATVDHRFTHRDNEVRYQRPVNCDPENTQWIVNIMYDAHNNVRQIIAQGPPAFPQEPPADRSDATIFTFADYHDADDLAKTLHVLFPLGTRKKQIEKVLVSWAGALAFAKVDEPQQVIYSYSFDVPTADSGSHPHRSAWNITAHYANDNSLSELFVAGPDVTRVFDTKETTDYLRPRIQAFEKRKREHHK